MKYVRIEENRRIAVEKAMTKALEEARAYVMRVESMELTKDDCNCLINDLFGNIVHIIEENDLEDVAVTVWNKDTVNPANIDRKLIDVMWDYRAETYFIIKKKTSKDQIINRLYRLCDYLDLLLVTADRTGEMEEEAQTQETETQEEETMTQTIYEIVTINGFAETVRVSSAPLFTSEEAANKYIEEHKYKSGADLWTVRVFEEEAQNEDKTEETTSEAPDTTAVTEPQTEEEYVQPAWKRILAELDKRREAEKVCVDIS